MSSQKTFPIFLREPEELKKLNQWLFDNIQLYVRGRTLEIGSGAGNISSLFVDRSIPIYLSDPIKANRDNLRATYENNSIVHGVLNIDLRKENFYEFYSQILETFTTVIALNVTENNYHESKSLDKLRHLLRADGHLIIVLPSFTATFYGVDISLQDWRNYNRKPLNVSLRHFEMLKTRYFNISPQIESDSSYKSGYSVLVAARKL